MVMKRIRSLLKYPKEKTTCSMFEIISFRNWNMKIPESRASTTCLVGTWLSWDQ